MPNEFNEEEVLRRLGMAVDPRRWRYWVPLAIVVVLLLIAGWTSFYTVDKQGQGVVKRFGRVVGVTDPGLHFKMPFWIDRVTFVPTRKLHKQEFGWTASAPSTRAQMTRNEPDREESLMLTGDLNVVDVKWVVQYRISDPVQWLHRVRDSEETFRDISESVMRQIVGNRYSSRVLTVEREKIAAEAREQMQRILHGEGEDSYNMGVQLTSVELQDVNPPDPVKPAYNDVNQARQKKEQLINEAERERNRKIPRAKGEAQRTITEAEGTAIERVNRAKGDVARFDALVQEYQQSPEVMRRRLYLEMLDNVLPKVGEVYVVGEGGRSAPLPLLNLQGRSGGIAEPRKEQNR
jgi:membrane protease subunit HflK